MASASSRSSANTDLYIGTLKAAIGLFGTEAKPGKEEKFDTAGPSGGVLRYEQRGHAAPVEEAREEPEQVPVGVDALTGDPGPEEGARGTGVHEALAAAFGGSEVTRVDGEFVQVLIEAGTEQVVLPEDVRRGVRLDDGRFIDVTDQLDAITERTKLDRIEVVRCIDATRVTRERVTGAYYIGAQDAEAQPILRLLYEALRARREAAVVKYTTKSRQHLGVIVPHAKTGTLMLLSLIFAEDFREAPAKATAIKGVAVSQAHVDVMTQILAAMHGTVDVFDELRDDAIALREELKTRALAGEMDVAVVEPVPVAEEAPIEDALNASLAAVRAGKV